MTEEIGLHGTPQEHQDLKDGTYTSPDEYADQGDERIVKDLMFGYTVGVEDPSGAVVVEPREAYRGDTVTRGQIGLIALRKGEQNGSFWTSKELEAIRSGRTPESVSTGELPQAGVSELGEYELADWLKGETAGQEKAPTINEVLETVGADKEFARRMLQAENIATDGDPRKGLEAGLQRIQTGA